MINNLAEFSKKNIFVILIIIISSLYLLPLFSPGFIIGHDSLALLARDAARIEAIKDGQFPQRWAGDLNYGFGNPSFIFFYPLGGYLLAFLHFLKIPLENAYEILLGTSFILSPVIFYFWVKHFLKTQAAFIGAIFYGLSPYLFMNLYVRAHVGELLSFVFIPLVFYFLEKYFKKPRISNLLLGSISYALFIQTHVILSLMFSFLFAGYIILKSGAEFRKISGALTMLLLGLILSAYFWIPSVFESKFINSQLFVGEWYKDHFLNIFGMFYSPWGFGSNVNESGGLAPQIGIVHSILLSAGLLLIISKRKLRKNFIFWLTFFLLGLFMASSSSSFLWEKMHILQKFQFPWRFIALSSFCASVLIAYIFSIVKNKLFIFVIIAFLIATSFPMAKVWKSKSYGDKYYFNYSGTATYHNEATTIWVEGDAFKFPEKKVEIISGDGRISNYTRRSNLHRFGLNSKTNVTILDNTVYFPGWKAEFDGKKVPIEFQDPNHRGLITFNVPKGEHIVIVKFGESPVRLFSDMISLFGVLLIVFIFVSRKWIKRNLKI